MEKLRRHVVNILTLFMLAIGTLVVVFYCNKIVATSLQMLVLRDNAEFYIEQNADDTEEFIQNQELRNEQFYMSEDDVVRNFANQNFLVKTAIFLAAILMYPFILMVWLNQLNKGREVLIKKLKRLRIAIYRKLIEWKKHKMKG